MKKEKNLKLSDLGEFGFIARFSTSFLRNLPPEVVGIGDDCAVVPWKGKKKLLVTTDLLIDGVHFLKEKISAEDLGYKSLAVNLSDIAAMGGRPLYALLSLALAPETDVRWLDQFFNGWRALARKTKVQLLGGDTTKTLNKMVINVALLGEAEENFIRYRSAAEPGDIIAVTGPLGNSEGGLRLILSGLRESQLGSDEKKLLKCHYRPRPHLPEGYFLAHQLEVRAMMDVSDGIDSDLKRIIERSNCGVEVWLEKLPVSSFLKKCSQKYGWPLNEVAAAGGEDYCLLVTIDPNGFSRLALRYQRQFRRPLYPIGRITSDRGHFIYLLNGRPVALKKSGYDHFKT
ncbi:MAG: thiamine-phosphate kinase [Candidatus Saccharicenans sp.]|nr:MAG: thiamine-phosphate kinase [Candidatus Aminicenantes bacterium]HEK85851.1 thiamine-phosphate kinase [Candidatus Aminicenantes bacterium]